MTNLDCLPLKDLSRRMPNETPESRMARLAAKAVAAGCRLIPVDLEQRWTSRIGCTSASVPGLVYLVDIDPEVMSCTCPATTICAHISLALATLNLLPEAA